MADALARGERVEPLGSAGRITSPFCYWLIASPPNRARPEVAQFCEWVEAQAELTRAATGEDAAAPTPRPARSRSA